MIPVAAALRWMSSPVLFLNLSSFDIIPYWSPTLSDMTSPPMIFFMMFLIAFVSSETKSIALFLSIRRISFLPNENGSNALPILSVPKYIERIRFRGDSKSLSLRRSTPSSINSTSRVLLLRISTIGSSCSERNFARLPMVRFVSCSSD